MKRYLFLCLLSVGFITARAQYPIQILGLNLVIELNDVDKTATICNYDVKIHDDQNPKRISVTTNKVKRYVKGAPYTLVIPSVYDGPYGEKYIITTIGEGAFAGVKGVKYVSIPPTIKKIGKYAFFGSSLISVNLPPSVQTIGERAFGYCSDLKSLRIPANVAISQNLFAESKKLQVSTYNVSSDVSPVQQVASAQQEKERALADVDTHIPYGKTGTNDKTFAIIIANEQYLNQSVPRVEYALNDGRIFKTYCQRVLGIPNENIKLLENATYGQMTTQMKWLEKIAKAYDGEAKFILYYAGHGIPNEKDHSAYLLPVDASGDNTEAAYSLKKLYATLGGLNAQSVMVFLDACFSGQRGDDFVASNRGVAIKPREEVPSGHMVVFSAVRDDETAYPYKEKGHGLFTYFLLKKLQETEGSVNLGELGDYIKTEVHRRSIIINDKPQTPTVFPAAGVGDSWKNMKLK